MVRGPCRETCLADDNKDIFLLPHASSQRARESASTQGVYRSMSDLLALSARQVMGSLDITLSKTPGGEWNFSDTKVFLKNMGSAGSDTSSSG